MCLLPRASAADISLYALYGYNLTWRNFGGIAATASIPFGKHFEFDAACQFNSPSVLSATAVFRPVIPFRKSTLYFELAGNSSSYYRYNTTDYTLAASAGYKMDYFNLQLGLTTRLVKDNQEGGVIENKLNYLYKIVLSARPEKSRWNISAAVASFDEFQYDKVWQPRFYLDGKYRIGDHCTAFFRTYLKPAGLFNMTTHFWEISFRPGISFNF